MEAVTEYSGEELVAATLHSFNILILHESVGFFLLHWICVL